MQGAQAGRDLRGIAARSCDARYALFWPRVRAVTASSSYLQLQTWAANYCGRRCSKGLRAVTARFARSHCAQAQPKLGYESDGTYSIYIPKSASQHSYLLLQTLGCKRREQTVQQGLARSHRALITG